MWWVELLCDPATDERIRGEWARLEAADLPNLSRHRSASNQPHVTVSGHDIAGPARPEPDSGVGGTDPVRPADAEIAGRLGGALAGLPIEVRPGPLAVFETGGRRTRYVLVRTLTVNRDLLALHAAVLDAMGTGDHDHPHHAPGAWVPHLSLATRLTADQVSAALVALAGRRPPGASSAGSDSHDAPNAVDRDGDLVLDRARLWDSEARRVVEIDPSPPTAAGPS